MKEFLPPEQRSQLRLQHRSEKDRRTADRIKAVLLSDKGWTFRQIAEALLLDEETISKHVTEYIESHKLKIQTGGSASKLDLAQTEQLIAHLTNTTYMKVSDICAYVSVSCNVIYTVPGMRSWLHVHNFSYKKPKNTPAKADPIKQEAFIKAYEELLRTTPEEEPILFGDGVHPTMATKTVYGWIKKGTDKPILTSASRTRMNLLGAINLDKMKVTIGSYETINSDSMVDFFDRLKEAYPKAPKIHMILDLGPYNVSKVTQEAAQLRNIVLHYLPPYSPNLNSIERLWKVMNEHVRNNRFFKDAKEFRQSIMNFFSNTWPEIASSMVDRINDNFQRLKSAV
jgi:transposase